MPPTSTAYIALGSNLGNREEYLRSGMNALRRLGTVGAVSAIYETEPVGTIRQANFLNAVVEVRTALSPESLLDELLKTEQEHGRDRSASPPKGPRTLDLDLLSYGGLVLETPSLTLPHPALAERRFVLVPLEEIAPDWKHPISGKTASQMLAELAGRESAPGPAVRRIATQSKSS